VAQSTTNQRITKQLLSTDMVVPPPHTHTTRRPRRGPAAASPGGRSPWACRRCCWPAARAAPRCGATSRPHGRWADGAVCRLQRFGGCKKGGGREGGAANFGLSQPTKHDHPQPTRLPQQEAGTLPSPSNDPAISLHWAPTLGRPYELVAVSYGASVGVTRLDGSPTSLEPTSLGLLTHPSRVWRVEFNAHGNALGASLEAGAAGVGEVWLYMPTLGGVWGAVSKIEGGGAAVVGME
jgi:hypothetical protein